MWIFSLKSTVGIPQIAFPKKHGLHTQSMNQLKAEKNVTPTILNQSVLWAFFSSHLAAPLESRKKIGIFFMTWIQLNPQQ
jgi:hypothetical protein